MIIEYENYQIKPCKESPTLYIIVTAGRGGKIPDILSGMYTTTGLAKLAIDGYLSTKTKKGVEDGDARSKGGS